MRRLGATVVGIVGLLFGAASCNQIGGIHEGVPRGDDPVVPCSAVEDCEKVEAPECRVPVACDQGLCSYGDALEGTPVRAQVPGDCTEVVCDGAGKTKLFTRETDVSDDGNVCTLDTCAGTKPVHSMQTELPCYTGPASAKGKGICIEGTQHCDAQGNAIGGCEGEVLPDAETCISPLDEDCDGKANEEGNGCVCVPGNVVSCYTGAAGTAGVGICQGGMWSCNADGLGYGMCIGEQKPQSETCDAGEIDEDCDGKVNEEGADCMCGDGYVSASEECDDGDLDSTDACTEFCKVAVCGDGFVQAGVETCEDNNADDTDACLTTCVQASCGDGFVQAGMEMCDDGNADDNDTCPTTCVPASCGDGFMHAGVEACDDGNAVDTDACPTTCVPASCGDGFVQAGVEGCDDGNADSTDVCTALCQIAACGDGFIQPSLGETCDDGAMSGFCSPTCQEQKVLQVVGGSAHTCALLSGGSVKCWGWNHVGQLGLGDTMNRGDGPNEMGNDLPAVNLGTGKTASAIVAGNNHTCALLNDGSVKCWGHNSRGQLGLGDTIYRGGGPNEMGDDLPTVDLGTGKTASAIVAGNFLTCALLNDGSVKCWGYNGWGQLGLGEFNDHGDDPNEMGDNLPGVDLGTGKTASAIVAGDFHVCALLNDYSVKCWGAGGQGQLGRGFTGHVGYAPNQMGDNLPTVNLGTGLTASAIVAIHHHTCASLNDGSVKCWGSNSSGQLGLGDTNNRGDEPNEMGDNLLAINIGTGKTASAMSGGGSHTCALLNEGSVKCWGSNSSGQLGLGDTNNRGDGPNEMGDNLLAINLGTGKTASAMSGGGGHTCALLNDGSVKCWGSNSSGQLGLGDTNNRGIDPNDMGDNLPTVKLFSPFW